MSDDRLRHVLGRLAAHAENPDASVGTALCATATEVLRISGAGISVHGSTGVAYSLAVVGDDMETIHELERTLGEGPCVDAYHSGQPTAEPDVDAGTSWPAFLPEARRTSARALFGFPVRIADQCVGALNLYATRPGPLAPQQHRDALLLAELSSHVVVASLLAEPRDSAAHDVAEAVRSHDHIHQATGRISVQLQIPIVDALARLRARAFAEERPVAAVAIDVVEGRLRFEE